LQKAHDTDGLCPASLSALGVELATLPWNAWQLCVEQAATLLWNQWQFLRGISGNFRMESVATFAWNTQLPKYDMLINPVPTS
jgi:hypothetical protein